MLECFFDLTQYITDNTVRLNFYRKDDRCRLLSTVIIVDYQLSIRVWVACSLTHTKSFTCVARNKLCITSLLQKKEDFSSKTGFDF